MENQQNATSNSQLLNIKIKRRCNISNQHAKICNTKQSSFNTTPNIHETQHVVLLQQQERPSTETSEFIMEI